MRRRNQSLVLLRRRRNNVDVSFETRTNPLVGTANSGATIQNEILRQQMQQHPVAFQPNLGGHFHCRRQIVRRHLVRPAKFTSQASALRALHVHAAAA